MIIEKKPTNPSYKRRMEEENSIRIKGIIKIIASVFIGLITLMVFGFVIYLLAKKDFTVEGVISLLLAFFSIMISALFYFKSEESNSKFYDSSYNFMKDVSMKVGRFDARFGEQLRAMDENIKQLDPHYEKYKKDEIKEAESEKDRIIEKLINQSKLNDKEKAKYREELNDKNEKIKELQSELEDILREPDGDDEVEHFIFDMFYKLSNKKLELILKNKRVDEDILSSVNIALLKRLGYINNNNTLSSTLENMIDFLIRVRS